ncbi:hypothetical protein Noda2021_12170 [Candidatus Dependentiae bacterium Noda2021]|nr:hypothetical protein Noda2021_12170 [Candidatus Dependentiae bacterium Noda2021]
MQKKAVLILPNQLFKDHPLVEEGSVIILYEHPAFLLILHFINKSLFCTGQA